METKEQLAIRGLERVLEVTKDSWTRQVAEHFLFEANQTENIYLNRLKEQYELVKKSHGYLVGNRKADYNAMRLFCLDTQLVSFSDIEVMENEVNQSF